MNMNLAMAWGDNCAPPQSPFLSFSSPQREDLLFDSGETIELRCQAGLRSVSMAWTLHRNMIKKPFRNGIAEAVPGNRFVIRLSSAGLHPGFYDLKVELETGVSNDESDPLHARPVRGVCTFGWKVAGMPVAATRPADFTSFWDNARAKLATIPLDANEGRMTTFTPEEINTYNVASACLPPDYDPGGRRVENVESCKVDFAGPGAGRIYGWLAKPQGAGRYPAMLVLPGAGFAARPRPLEHARHGYVALDIQVHGQEVDLKKYPAIPGYYSDAQFVPADAYYYYHIHLRCLQALHYLACRPDVDASRIVVVGGSQGGRLAVVVAGLDSRVRAIVSCIANSPNHPHLRWVSRCNGSTDETDSRSVSCDGMDVAGAPPVLEDDESRAIAYYDPMNYAGDVRCPVLMNAGLIDPVSPPFSVWAVFNKLGCINKTMTAIDGHGHDWSAEFDRRAWRWLESTLAEKPVSDRPEDADFQSGLPAGDPSRNSGADSGTTISTQEAGNS